MWDAMTGLLVLVLIAGLLCGLVLAVAFFGRVLLGGTDREIVADVCIGIGRPLLRFAAVAVLFIWLLSLLGGLG